MTSRFATSLQLLSAIPREHPERGKEEITNQVIDVGLNAKNELASQTALGGHEWFQSPQSEAAKVLNRDITKLINENHQALSSILAQVGELACKLNDTDSEFETKRLKAEIEEIVAEYRSLLDIRNTLLSASLNAIQEGLDRFGIGQKE